MSRKRDTTDEIVATSGGLITTGAALPAPVVGWVEVPPLGTPLDLIPTSLDMAREECQCQVYNAMLAPDLVFGSNGECQFDLVDWIVYADQGPDPETGEVSEFVRICLLTADGDVFKTTSEMVKNGLDRLIRWKRQRHFDPPVPITIRERRSLKTGRTYHEMRVRLRAGGR